MLEVVKYSPDKKKEWDEFVKESDIPVFMFLRDYLEYHKDRFNSLSLMVYDKKKLKAVLPGHVKERTYYSHQGLTFGGLIKKKNIRYVDTLGIYNAISIYLKSRGILDVSVKLHPSFYSETYDQSQMYMFQSKLKSYSDLKLGACIYTHKHNFPKSSIEKRKLKLEDFELTTSEDYESFWSILENNLSLFHNTKPVHSLKEITYLTKIFPNNIQLYIAKNKRTGKIDAGAVLYKFKNVLKLQYQAASEQGRTNRASHALYYGFISKFKNEVDHIDLGNCMDDVDVVNTNLLYIKERFGAKVYSMLSFEYSSDQEFV